MQVELTQSPSFELVKNYWSQLCANTPGHAFLNECWIAPWFEVVSQHHNPILITVKNSDSIVGLAIAHILTVKRRGIFKRKILFFNEVPETPNDMVIEYNGILAAQSDYSAVWNATLAALKNELVWDEIKVNKIDPTQTPFIKAAANENALLFFSEREDTSPIALLAKDSKWEDVEKLNISSNRRRQVRKATQLYEQKYGQLNVHTVTDLNEVESFWNEMANLHTAHWNDKGDSGAFANPVWTKFNRAMISQWLALGQIQLTKYIAGDTVIGYLFNLVIKDRAYNIQCGFLYEDDNRLKPGFVCHHACMKLCHQLGIQEYYYLAGGEDYKVSLSSKIDTLDWLCLRKSNAPFLLEDTLVEIVRKLRLLLKK
ncbi:GNAT family N-acetyltransferase [Saccharophagus degradans]|uniref:GNAT family N-acetyltransferase n=1 Tax=Saccharophagus degradans TaxID=86304 RepID=UPI001C09A990|nr:GNAT family N-acetyltransferase [Saccharophagus degradans]MBU2986859.1 GNAT family N-acetyltransferase [Saccharophagus degradans]